MLEGEIRDIDLVARLVELWREQFTGAIRFENDGIIKIIYFKGGDVLSASTNDRADSVDEILMRAGKVSREHVKQALAKRKENETLGDTLLNLGFITRKELTWARRVQVVGVIRSIGEWQAGTYTIVEDYLPKRDEGTIFSLPQLIVEMVVTDQDRPKFERLLESGSVVFSKAAGFPDGFAKLGLNDDADKIVSEVDGIRTATEVAAASGQETFNAYKLLHGLSLLGLLTHERGAAPAGEALSFENAGVTDAADAWAGEMPKFDLGDEPEPGQETTPLRTPPPPPPLLDEPMAPSPVKEETWGFDEAQIEAARKATIPDTPPPPMSTPASRAASVAAAPAPRPPRDFSGTSTTRRMPTKSQPKKKSHFGLIVALMALFIAAGVAYFAFMWWNGRNAAQPAPVAAVRKPIRRAPVVPTPVPVPTTTAPATTTSAGSTTATATTTTPGPTPTATVATATHAPVATTSRAPVTTTRAAATTPTTTRSVAPPTPPKPEPVVPITAPASTDTERYAAMAREFAAAPAGKFTVQFEIVCDPSNITKALRTGGTNVWFVPISLKGRSCYRVFWGHYETRDAAERGMRDIPGTLREAKPAVVSVPHS